MAKKLVRLKASFVQSLYQQIAALTVIALVIVTGVYVYRVTHAATGWSSGASYYPDGITTFGNWRGSPSTIYGCWNDHDNDGGDASGCLSSQKAAGYKYDVDLAVGLLVSGDTMANAANGAYEARWRSMATSIRNNWGTARTVYIRPAHEMNGNWYKWSVTNGNVAQFRQAFARYATIIKTELKDKGYNAKVTLSYNWDSNPSGVSIDAIWPGDQYVDVVGVDRYDANWSIGNPGINTTEAHWNDVLSYNDKAGNYGLNNWLAFAQSHGKPLAFPEWGLSDKTAGDNPFWITKMHDFFAAHAGTGPGQVLFEVYFNIGGYGATKLYPNPESPNAANRYKSLSWGNGGTGGTPTATPVPTPTPTPTPTPNPSISQTGNLVSGKSFISSVADSTAEPGNPVSHLNDKNETTRWISEPQNNATISTDLGASYTLNKVSVLWAGDTVKNYQIQISTNNSTWATVANGTTNNTSPQLINTMSFTTPATGRYLRIVGVDRWDPDFGNSIYEIGAYGALITAATIGDVNNDSKVNVFDLSALLSRWASNDAASDFNHDGTVNVFDLSALLSHWTG